MDAHPPNPACGDDRRSRFYSKSCASFSDTCTQTAVISDVRFAVVVSPYKTDVDFLMVAQRREDNIEIRGVGASSMS